MSSRHLGLLGLAATLLLCACAPKNPPPADPQPVTASEDAHSSLSVGDHGTPDLDGLAQLYMQALAKGEFQPLRHQAFPAQAALDTLAPWLGVEADSIWITWQSQFEATQGKAAEAGVNWRQAKVLSANLKADAGRRHDSGTLYVLLNSEDKEMVFTARCAKIGLLWCLLGDMNLDAARAGI